MKITPEQTEAAFRKIDSLIQQANRNYVGVFRPDIYLVIDELEEEIKKKKPGYKKLQKIISELEKYNEIAESGMKEHGTETPMSDVHLMLIMQIKLN